MFYPVDSLKRGGRFYLCWVADSWPLRFATITHRQLWSQDVRKICDDLLQVMNNESGRPAKRFSLRLSSQLMRGLVRLYQRKVTVFLGDLCMLNAHVTKNVNKKWNIHEVINTEKQLLPRLAPPQITIEEQVENEQRIEEIIQRSGNIVENIQDITLKESTVPQNLLPTNDGFGEENEEQQLNLLKDQTVEIMLVQDGSAIQHSGLELPGLDITDKGDKSHDYDKSRLAPHDSAQMERISEHDITLFRKSTGLDRLTMGGLEKDVPEIPEVQLPDLPVPQPVIIEPLPKLPYLLEAIARVTTPGDQIPRQIREVPVEEISAPQPQKETDAASKQKSPIEIELEELEEEPQPKKRRFRNRLIIDKKIKLSTDYLLPRIENPHVELRCEDSSDDIVDTRLTVDILFRRPCHAGRKVYANIGLPLTRLFQKNLGVVNRLPSVDREMEEAAARRSDRIQKTLERIEEEQEPIPQILIQIEQPETEAAKETFLNITEPQNVSAPFEQLDISMLPTQKLPEPETRTQKRASQQEIETPTKKPRLSGYVSFRKSQQLALERSEVITEVEKENLLGVAINQPLEEMDVLQPRDTNIMSPNNAIEKSLTVMLEKAGLADLQQKLPIEEPPQISQRQTRRGGSESSETPLGSLDRTKVSLGDSDQTTDSKKFIREQWGTEATMLKILRKVVAGVQPLTVKRLIRDGPVISGYKAMIAARCFTSILKLKQHGFIDVKKDPESLEILDINLGTKFSHIQ